MRCLVVSALALAISGCCLGGGDDYLTFGVAGNGSTTPQWGETMEWTGRLLTVRYDYASELQGEPIEIYRDQAPVEVPSTETLVDRSQNNGCGYGYVREYDLSGLELEVPYTVVHRRHTGTGDPINCMDACPWETFDGDEALVMTLVLIPPIH